MPIPIQNGGIADQLRNFLQLVGRAGTTLDEVVVPIVNLMDLGQQPWRTNTRAFAFQGAAIGGAATFPFTGVRIKKPLTGVAVVQRVVLTNPTAAALRYDLQIADNPQSQTNYAETPAIDTEFTGIKFVAGFPNFLPVTGFGGVMSPISWTSIMQARVPPNDSKEFLLNVALRSGQNDDPSLDGPGLVAIAGTVNITAMANFYGTWYPDAL